MPAFKKGQKAGPGRPKGMRNHHTIEVTEAARPHTAEAIAKIVAIMRRSKSDQAVVAAAREILDRGHGRPPQTLTHGGHVRVTHEEALKLIADRITQFEDIATPDITGNGNGRNNGG